MCCSWCPAGAGLLTPVPKPAWVSGNSGTGLGRLLPALPLPGLPARLVPPECCSVAIVAVNADEGDAEAAARPVLSAALLAVGEVAALQAEAAAAGAATAPEAALLLLLSPASDLPAALLTAAGFLLPVLASLLTRVAAVALNSVDLGAGSLNVPGLAAVRAACCCCFISLQALSLARMSPVAACACAETAPVRSALNTPGLSAAAAADLLTVVDMLRPLGVCMTCLLWGAALAALPACSRPLLTVPEPAKGVAAGGAGVMNCCSGACRCSAWREPGPGAGVGRGGPPTPRARLPLAAVLGPALPVKGVAAWCECCNSQPALPKPARLARPVNGPLGCAPCPLATAGAFGCRYLADTCKQPATQPVDEDDG